MPKIRLRPADRQEVALLVYVTQGVTSPTRVHMAKNGVLHIHLNTTATGTRLNHQLIRYLAYLLSVPESHLRIVAGEQGQGKVILVRGLPLVEVERRLRGHLGARQMPRLW